ncbi:hypothetical protein COX67_01980 [Candidatus Falkowbacteria bacterium CG_4_10_14_0_2_um_filter_36_22]|nr:MAG: hypothetical protein COX67_01980 [Candidatus Falkowbacteria bacterium CG_4_10_14_0_2_um_filter_36_22]
MALPPELKIISMNNKTLKNSQGFTLIEMMVAVSIFSIVILAATGILNYVLKGQVASVASQNVQESMRYALEVMSKEIRTAPEVGSGCSFLFSPVKIVYNISPGFESDYLYFINKKNECILYNLDNNRIMISRDLNKNNSLDANEFAYITPDAIEVTDLKFKVLDDAIDAFHTVQPLVVMSMDVKSKNTFVKDKKVRIETAISSRFYR